MHFQIIEKGNNCGNTDTIRQLPAVEIRFFTVDLPHLYFTYITQNPFPIR